MVRILIRLAVFLGTAAVGLLLASWIVNGFELHVAGFLVAIIVFAIVQSVVVWLLRAAPGAAPFAGIISTFVALLLATLISDGLAITTLTAWLAGVLIVWILTAVGGWLASRYILKEKAHR